ncbi:CotH kinase family protein [Verrucomicrobiaceae bacterium 227]
MNNVCRAIAPIVGSAIINAVTAAPITWETATDTTNPTVVLTTGALVEAINASSTPGAVTVNDVTFSQSDTLLPLTAAASALGAFESIDPGLDELLNTVDYGGGTSTSITVGNGSLVIGQSYLIQIFFTDLRTCCSSRVMTYGDGLGNNVNVTASGAPGTFGQNATGSFVADSTSQTISLVANGFGNVHINGYQIRSAFPLPEINSFTATPSLIANGESTTLDWQITDADTAGIDNGIGSVDASSGSLVVSPTSTTTYTLTATNGGGTTTSEVTVGVDVPVLPPVLNEFLASNDSDFADEDGNFSDWIEIYNPNAFAIDLDGYHLTNDPTLPTQWSFPAGTSLSGNSFLIVFATGTSRGLPELHTNFKIPASGGYLALIEPDGTTVINEFTNYPAQRTDISFGSGGYFSPPTPAAANGTPFSGFVDDTAFDIDRGFYDSSFTVNITTATPGATIVHTTDGTPPSLTNGTATPGTASVFIDATTTLRAAAFKDGLTPTNIDTQTYLFPADIVTQPQMDADVVNSPAYTGEIAAALQSVRTLSIVTDPDHLFSNAIGILANTGGRGLAWERLVSIEFLDPENPAASYQTNAGLRMHGNGSRSSPKNSLRLLFRADYGLKKLDYPLFGEDWVARKFNTVVLRAQNANSWTSPRAEDRTATTFLQDSFAKDTQGAMDQPTAGSTFVHLYLNGTYWGLYNPTERPDGSFGEDHFGGDDTDYDAVSRRFSVEVQSGTKTHWDEMITYSNNLLDTQAEYETLQQDYMDVDNLIDYMLVHQFMQTRDGPDDFGHNNMRLVRRNNPAGLWQAYAWDMEYSMIDTNGTRDYSYPFPIYSSSRNNNNDITDSIASIYIRLKDNNPEFQLRYADRAYKHLFNGGALSPASATARFESRAMEIESAVIGESARWGDQRRTAPYTRDGEWTTERNRITTEFFPARPAHVVSQLRIAGLYPSIDPPVFSQHGGAVPVGFGLGISSPSGTIYYTTDGSDPREAWTNNALGTSYTTPLNLTGSLTVKARTLDGGEWSALAEADFLVGTLANATNLVASEIYYHPPVGLENDEFIELLNVSSETIELLNATFTAGISYTFTQSTLLAPGERIVISKPQFLSGTALANSGERIALSAADGSPIFDFSYDDEEPWPTSPDTDFFSLVYLSGDPAHPANWRASTTAGGNPGRSDSIPFTGGDLVDYAFASPPAFEPITGTLSVAKRPGADEAILTPQWSTDLKNWRSNGFQFQGSSPLRWHYPTEEPQIFLRLLIEQP